MTIDGNGLLNADIPTPRRIQTSQQVQGGAFGGTLSIPTRVRLSLAEIGALQKAADADPEVKAALVKIQHLIEVGVTF